VGLSCPRLLLREKERNDNKKIKVIKQYGLNGWIWRTRDICGPGLCWAHIRPFVQINE